MTEGIYLSPGKTVAEINAERERQAQREAERVSIDLSLGDTCRSTKYLLEQSHMLSDAAAVMDFLQDVIRAGGISPRGEQGIAATLGLCSSAIFNRQEQMEETLSTLEAALKSAGHADKEREIAPC